MKLMRDFRCDKCDLDEERFVDTTITQYPCTCGGMMTRMIGMPTVKLEGITGAFPGAHDRWARIREDNARIKAKRFSAEP